MAWQEMWLDTAIAPASDDILAALQQSGARGLNFYLGGRFNGGVGWTPQLAAQLAQARPDVAQYGTWVSLRPGQGGYALGHQDGLDCVAAARAYPAITWLVYDIEPITWQAWPTGVADAMRGFADAVHGAGYHAIDYGTPSAVAAASNEEVIWIANPNPGGADPALQPLNPAYYAGRRAVQYGTAVFAGATWDVTHSEFSLGGVMIDQATLELLQQNLPLIGKMAYVILPPPGQDGAAGEVPQRLRDLSAWVGAEGDLAGAIARLAAPDPTAFATALAPLLATALQGHLPAEVDTDALASALVHDLAAQLAKLVAP